MCITKVNWYFAAVTPIGTFALSSIERTNVFAAQKEDATDLRYACVATVKLASWCLERKLFLAQPILKGTLMTLPSTELEGRGASTVHYGSKHSLSKVEHEDHLVYGKLPRHLFYVCCQLRQGKMWWQQLLFAARECIFQWGKFRSFVHMKWLKLSKWLCKWLLEYMRLDRPRRICIVK